MINRDKRSTQYILLLIPRIANWGLLFKQETEHVTGTLCAGICAMLNFKEICLINDEWTQ